MAETTNRDEMSYDAAEQYAETYGEPAAEECMHFATVTDETRLAWLVEGALSAGTLAEYAHDHEQGHYADVAVSDHVWIVHGDELVKTAPVITTTPFDSHDYATVVIALGDAVATYRLDGRA